MIERGAAMKRFVRAFIPLAIILAVFVAGCAAGTGRYSVDEPASFRTGLWHGAISGITLIIHIFNHSVRIYEANNTGGWYDFGFLFGVICVWGGGSSAGCRSKKKKKDEEEWKEVGAKIELKIKRKLREWAEADEDESWKDVEEKVERKIRDKIRKWAEDEDE